jgi:protein-L-isoaspartate(D-aspartate) O-methyltransferase
MVIETIELRGIKDPLTLKAMRAVPRHEFVEFANVTQAYADRPLPIGFGQTISQPYIVAAMTELLNVKEGATVLEIGAGSGYQAAVLAEFVDHVYTIEIVPQLAKRAGDRLKALGYDNVTVKEGDGYYGWAEHGPFDGIIVTAAATHIPPPLVEQLKPGGRMVIPVGPPMQVQNLMVVEKNAEGEITQRSVMAVRFVPFTGRGTGL